MLRDTVSNAQYLDYIKRRKDSTAIADAEFEMVDDYVKGIQDLLKAKVTQRVLQIKARHLGSKETSMKVDHKPAGNKTIEGTEVPQAKTPSNFTSPIKLNRRTQSMAGLRQVEEGDYRSPGSVENNRFLEKSLLEVMQTHPKIFKTSSINLTRRKMQKIAGEEGRKLDINTITGQQRERFSKVLVDKYTAVEQKRIYDICLNYKDRVTHPSKNKYYYHRTKEMINNNVENLKVQIEEANKDLDRFAVKRQSSKPLLVRPTSVMAREGQLSKSIKTAKDSPEQVKAIKIMKNFSMHLLRSGNSSTQLERGSIMSKRGSQFHGESKGGYDLFQVSNFKFN